MAATDNLATGTQRTALNTGRSLARRAIASLALLSVLSGCAECNILSTHNSALCTAKFVGLLAVTAPVMLPYSAISNARREGRAAKEERALRENVERGNLAASEECIFECPRAFRAIKDDRPRISRLAAQQVIDAYARLTEPSPKQQAIEFAAHKTLADALWKEDPKARVVHLTELVRIGQSQAMWSYVKKDSADGNDLPVNGGYFSDAADFAVIDLVALRHEARIAREQNPDLPMDCDFSGLVQFLTHTSLDRQSLCKLAEDFRKRQARSQTKSQD